MRVLVITTWFPSARHDGSGIFNLRDVELLQQNHAVHVIHLIRSSLMTSDEPTIETLDSGPTVERIRFDWRDPKAIFAAISIIRRRLKSVDILHSMAFPALIPMRLLRIRVPWVHTEHWSGLTRLSTNPVKRVAQKLLRRVLSLPDVIVVVSHTLGRITTEITKREPQIIGNSVKFPEGGAVASRWQGTGPLKIISVAGAEIHKGPLQTIHAVRLLRDQGIEAKLTWLGRGRLLETAKKLAVDLGIKDFVSLPGSVSPEKVRTYLLQSHIFVLPTDGETFGVAIAEALAAGLPVVVTGRGGHEDFVTDEVGRFAASREPREIAKAVQVLLESDDVLAPKMISKYARELFSDEVRQIEYEKAYESAKARRALK